MIEPLKIGVAHRPAPGEEKSGDRCFVQQWAERAIVALIDGLGHGPEAAMAAEAAQAALQAPDRQSPSMLIQRCHERLRETRGAALTVMQLDTQAWQLEWIGVGNVMAVLLHPEPTGRLTRTELFGRGGVAGVQLPSTATCCVRIAPGDVLVAATDGVHSNFAYGIARLEPPQQLAERLLTRYCTGYDDAMVVVAQIQRSEA
jgi:negative regulator of sigma-B (phosphoserine phosphatase)